MLRGTGAVPRISGLMLTLVLVLTPCQPPPPARRPACSLDALPAPPPLGALSAPHVVLPAPVRRPVSRGRAPCGIVVITVNFAAVTAKKAGDFRGVATQVALRIGVRGQRWPRSRMASTIPVRSCGPRSRRETRCHMCSSTPRARTPSKRAGSLAHSCCAAVTGVHAVSTRGVSSGAHLAGGSVAEAPFAPTDRHRPAE